MTPDLRLEAQSNPCWLQAIRGLVRSYLNHFDLDPDHVDDIVLAVDEACANVIRHSYAGNHYRSMRLSLLASAEHITFQLEDDGVPVQMDKVIPSKPEEPQREHLRPGGLGVQLMYSVFDEVIYCPGETLGNCVVMRISRK